MTPRMWFALVLRYLGVGSLMTAISYLVTAYDVQKGLNMQSLTVLAEVNHATVQTVMGLVLLFFADRISAFFVPAQRAAPTQGEPSDLSPPVVP